MIETNKRWKCKKGHILSKEISVCPVCNFNEITKEKIEERNKKILKLRTSKNIATGREGYSYEEIGKIFGLTRERVRQILYRQLGHTPSRVFGKNLVSRKCLNCNNQFDVYASSKKMFCNSYCKSKKTNILGKPMKEYTKKDWEIYNKLRNDRLKEYHKEYNQREDVIARRRLYQQTDKYKGYQRNYKRKNYYLNKLQNE